MDGTETATPLQLWGAGAFGMLIGWLVYYINRYRKADVQLSDLVTLIGIIGGGAVLALFPAKTDLVLIFLVGVSKNFTVDFFLDGRRKKPKDDYYIPGEVQPTVHAMEE